jgi:hypothetical protein
VGEVSDFALTRTQLALEIPELLAPPEALVLMASTFTANGGGKAGAMAQGNALELLTVL